MTKPLPHDQYIEAVTVALDTAGLEVKDGWTDDCETRGTYCYLNAVIELDVSTVGVQDAWPHGLLLTWEWHTGIEADDGPARGPQWQFAEMNADGSSEYATDLPVHGYAGPADVVEATRKVIAGDIGAGGFGNLGQHWSGWNGGLIGGTWERHEELDAACEAWATSE